MNVPKRGDPPASLRTKKLPGQGRRAEPTTRGRSKRKLRRTTVAVTPNTGENQE